MRLRKRLTRNEWNLRARTQAEMFLRLVVLGTVELALLRVSNMGCKNCLPREACLTHEFFDERMGIYRAREPILETDDRKHSVLRSRREDGCRSTLVHIMITPE